MSSRAARANRTLYYRTSFWFRERRNTRLSQGLQRMQAALDRPLRVLDVGGVETFWKQVRRPEGCELTVLNLPDSFSKPYWFPGDLDLKKVEGSALKLQDEYGRHDVVVCNSVIEHVGRWGEISECARQLSLTAPHGWVQTPAFGFPIEPHVALPLVHWLAPSLQVRVLRRLPHHGAPPERTLDYARRRIEANNLLCETDLLHLFPEADLHRERLLGLTKSFVATWGEMSDVWQG